VSIPITYFVLAPSSNMIPGLGLGSVGLALKIVILSAISANISQFFICKISKGRRNIFNQLISISLLIGTSFAIKYFLIWICQALKISHSSLLMMICCFPFYVLTAGLILYMFPELGGLEKRQIKNLVRFVGRLIRTQEY